MARPMRSRAKWSVPSVGGKELSPRSRLHARALRESAWGKALVPRGARRLRRAQTSGPRVRTSGLSATRALCPRPTCGCTDTRGAQPSGPHPSALQVAGLAGVLASTSLPDSCGLAGPSPHRLLRGAVSGFAFVCSDSAACFSARTLVSRGFGKQVCGIRARGLRGVVLRPFADRALRVRTSRGPAHRNLDHCSPHACSAHGLVSAHVCSPDLPVCV